MLSKIEIDIHGVILFFFFSISYKRIRKKKKIFPSSLMIQFNELQNYNILLLLFFFFLNTWKRITKSQ